ncbi:hypothetical protein F4811DRAFT_420492 [Daldinia bambusicola]|nr:hypothetical protein F4811DRAFT_420492 [Daldinia bambusicola]
MIGLFRLPRSLPGASHALSRVDTCGVEEFKRWNGSLKEAGWQGHNKPSILRCLPISLISCFFFFSASAEQLSYGRIYEGTYLSYLKLSRPCGKQGPINGRYGAIKVGLRIKVGYPQLSPALVETQVQTQTQQKHNCHFSTPLFSPFLSPAIPSALAAPYY